MDLARLSHPAKAILYKEAYFLASDRIFCLSGVEDGLFNAD